MSVHIVALGSECPGGVGPGDETTGPGQIQGGLLWSYLGHGARELDPNSVTPSRHPLNPAFMEYQSRVFGDVRVMVRDCPSWDLLDSDWASVRSVLEQADIVVIKYSVNDKLAFQQVRNVYAPRLRPLFRHWGVPVILVAVGARLNDEGPPCTCPLCASDWSSCVPHSEGLQLSRDLGATYLELPSLNNFFVDRYFGSVLEYFMIQCLKQKAKERPDKRRGHRFNEPRPPHLDQPGYVSLNAHWAWEWEYLEEAIAEKLKNPLAVAQLIDRIRSFVGREKRSAVRLLAGSVLPAHRAVLVARCDVMAAMFSGKYAEARSRVVPIHGVSSDTFLAFLEYLYTDTCCPASVLQAMAVLVCAEMYQVKRLQHLCEVCVCAYLQSMPSRELASTGIGVIRLLRRAKCHNADQLYVWLLHFIANNYLIFSHKPDFLELSGEPSV
ncbi:rho-related BTB domain-containing protein 3 [Sinocyclocheilus grahami]|uniref:rho-related BTB domain-containing protein 3 n=1 Tax=Sinocyclocheilus grahami TaxID=75366 RepID=UPI0007AD199C|nr:PREDICTED: rho-related BTB domain-containing protein 3 [Sinocyclocheilus grahami]